MYIIIEETHYHNYEYLTISVGHQYNNHIASTLIIQTHTEYYAITKVSRRERERKREIERGCVIPTLISSIEQLLKEEN